MRDKRLWLVGGLVIGLIALAALVVPNGAVADHHEKAKMAEAMNNHFKCYEVLDWGPWDPSKVQLEDQFGKSVARTMEPRLLCNPVDKNGEGIADKDYHLVCYSIRDDPQGPTERVKEVMVKDQSYQGPLWVGDANIVCMPAMKKYEPRG